jgi:hypothetical protein
MQSSLKESLVQSRSRLELWVKLVNTLPVEHVAEIGVFRGGFAVKLLRSCDKIKTYYMIDPWRHLEDWNKPANTDNAMFDRLYEATLKRTDFATDKRVVLRGKTTEVIDNIPDNSLDFAYLDGDHTLKGIAIDLIRVYPKMKPVSWIGGDDFYASVWQHPADFEPTLVFPFAVYFAEAVSAQIYALPYNQFLIEKRDNGTYDFVDLTGKYSDLGLRKQLYTARDFKTKTKATLFAAFYSFLLSLKRIFFGKE